MNKLSKIKYYIILIVLIILSTLSCRENNKKNNVVTLEKFLDDVRKNIKVDDNPSNNLYIAYCELLDYTYYFELEDSELVDAITNYYVNLSYEEREVFAEKFVSLKNFMRETTVDDINNFLTNLKVNWTFYPWSDSTFYNANVIIDILSNLKNF